MFLEVCKNIDSILRIFQVPPIKKYFKFLNSFCFIRHYRSSLKEHMSTSFHWSSFFYRLWLSALQLWVILFISSINTLSYWHNYICICIDIECENWILTIHVWYFLQQFNEILGKGAFKTVYDFETLILLLLLFPLIYERTEDCPYFLYIYISGEMFLNWRIGLLGFLMLCL